VGASTALRQILRQVEMVAPTDATVLILGESGTGKELVAREIHQHSHRAERPLIRVNCASIPRDLYESEFFGHARGAFTGALKDRAGRFEAADGGTLLLDEVAEIPPELQSKFLRVLQEKQYERVGEEKTRSVNVRIIAATNRNLKQEVAEGRFRQDLYYRLNVFPIEVAPLRERPGDIPLLAAHFLEQAARRLKLRLPRLTAAHVAELQSYDWPGNVRELQNVIERAVILAQNGGLHFDLPVAGRPVTLPAPAPDAAVPAEAGTILTEAELRRREQTNVLAALNQAGWKIHGPGGAAELLGLKPTTLISRIKKLGLKRRD
jgi:transcriptional regulator with GAF, ATPase, and Fis domain